MAVKIGEVQAKLSADVKKTEDLEVHLRMSWADKLEAAKFKPAQDLKKGDTLKITIEKV
jgi:ribosomal 50S subunit-recycling heat shock protein